MSKVYPTRVLYCRDFRVSPLLPATWALLHYLKKHLDNEWFTAKCLSVFEGGRILAGLKSNTLNNVHMTKQQETHDNAMALRKIYDLKLLRNVEKIPLSFFTFFSLLFTPQKIRDSELSHIIVKIIILTIPILFSWYSLNLTFHFRLTTWTVSTKKNPRNREKTGSPPIKCNSLSPVYAQSSNRASY